MAECQASTLESIIRGHHIYKQIWWPLVGEILTLEREEGRNHDNFTVSLLKNATVIGHVLRFGTIPGTEGHHLHGKRLEILILFVLRAT